MRITNTVSSVDADLVRCSKDVDRVFQQVRSFKGLERVLQQVRLFKGLEFGSSATGLISDIFKEGFRLFRIYGSWLFLDFGSKDFSGNWIGWLSKDIVAMTIQMSTDLEASHSFLLKNSPKIGHLRSQKCGSWPEPFGFLRFLSAFSTQLALIKLYGVLQSQINGVANEGVTNTYFVEPGNMVPEVFQVVKI